jgi:hypothetical protein
MTDIETPATRFPHPPPDDPNADLIGYTMKVGLTEFTITGTATWSVQYVNYEDAFGRQGCQSAGAVRRHKQLAA